MFPQNVPQDTENAVFATQLTNFQKQAGIFISKSAVERIQFKKTWFSIKHVRCSFDNPAKKFTLKSRMSFAQHQQSLQNKSSTKIVYVKLIIPTCQFQFRQPYQKINKKHKAFRWLSAFDETFNFSGQKRLTWKTSYGHIERCFDNPAKKFPQRQLVLAQCRKITEKYEKKLCFHLVIVPLNR